MKFTKRELDLIESRRMELQMYNEEWAPEKCFARASSEMERLKKVKGFHQVGLLEW